MVVYDKIVDPRDLVFHCTGFPYTFSFCSGVAFVYTSGLSCPQSAAHIGQMQFPLALSRKPASSLSYPQVVHSIHHNCSVLVSSVIQLFLRGSRHVIPNSRIARLCPTWLDRLAILALGRLALLQTSM